MLSDIEKIKALQIESNQAEDWEVFDLTIDALEGSRKAYRECLRIIEAQVNLYNDYADQA